MSEAEMVEAYLDTEAGGKLVEACRNECINGIPDGIEEYEVNNDFVPNEVQDSKHFEPLLVRRVLEAVAEHYRG